MKNLIEKLSAKGFIYEGRDDYESADGGLPTWERRIKNSQGEYVGDFLKANGFTESIETDKRGKTWAVFQKGDTTITHRAFGEKNFAGEIVKVKTFSIES